MSAELHDADARAERAVLADLGAIVALLGVEPAPEVPEDGGAVRDADDAALLAAILAAGRRPAGGGTDDIARVDAADVDAPAALAPRRRPAWRYVAAAAAVVALGVGATFALEPAAPPAVAGAPVMLHYSDGSPEDALEQDLPSARDTLLAAAEAADATPDPRPGGPVQLVQSTNWWGSVSDDGVDRVEETIPVVRSSWLAPDGSMVAEEAHYGSFAPSGSLVQPAIPPGVTNARDEFPAGTLDAGLAASLAADPSDAAHRLVVGLVRDRPCDAAQYECFVGAVQGLYMQAVVPSAARATLWRELASRPEARLLGRVSDRLGRSGVAVADVQRTDNGLAWVRVLVIDPASGDLLGVERISVEPGRGAIVQEVTVFTRHASVAEVGARP